MAEIRVGLAGTGFIARHLALSIAKAAGRTISRVLTRRPVNSVSGFPEGVVTNSIDDLVSNCDVVVECSGDAIWATETVSEAVSNARPVITMNTEFHITTGSAFVGKGLVTEAEGDQPGVLAALHEDVVAMGFAPVVYGNMKGFLNVSPTPEEMEFWARKQGISVPMVTSFTDGTKVQAEQILVANHFGATISREGMLGADVADLEEGVESLIAGYEAVGRPISDYVVAGGLPHGVFIVTTHEPEHAAALEYYKLGKGPYYTIVRPNIFVHLEILKTVARVLETGTVLLDNSAAPELSLAAVAKKGLKPGDRIDNGIGSFEMRGHAVRIADHPQHVPIGLIQNAVVTEEIASGSLVQRDQIEVSESLALKLWQTITAGLSG